ncbi:MAG TPA: pitrilysin family protein [bacterium]|nr:pitrilysin family protein [bacterium]
MIQKLVLGTVLLTGSLTMAATFSKENVRVHRLDNGLKVLLFEDHSIPNIAYYTFFRVGSRNERPGLTGVSHFIEHMMFNGSAHVKPGELDRIMEYHGGSNNAYTSDDVTAYTDWFPSAAAEKMIALEADRMQGCLFDPQVLESERGVVASERRLSVDNDNENLLMESVRATAIMAHPYHWDVIGWMSDIQSWKREEILAYYRQFYAPNNAVVVVVGDFKADAMIQLIERHYGAIAPGPQPPEVATVEPEQLGPRSTLLYRDAQTPSFLLAYPAPACTDPDFPAMQILELILLQGESSRLYQRLVAEEQLAIEIGGGIQETIDPLLFYISVKPRPGADVHRIEKIVEEELAQVAAEGIKAKELTKAFNAIETRFYASLQSIAGKANGLGIHEALYGDFAALFTHMVRFQKVQAADVQQAAGKYCTPVKKTLGLVLPKGETE